MNFVRLASSWLCLLLAAVWARGSPTDAQKNIPLVASVRTLDSGSFGVWVNGERIASESFLIEQNTLGSTITSEVKTHGVRDGAGQKSTLQLASDGNLRRYDWVELSPGTGRASIVPNAEFLTEQFSAGTPGKKDEKPTEQPILLPHSVVVLDDYFFIHRELAAWRYLAATCHHEDQGVQCPANQPAQLLALNPHLHESQALTLEYLGRETVSLRGTPRELNKLALRCESEVWTLWLDDQFKLVRVVVLGDGTEVLRD